MWGLCGCEKVDLCACVKSMCLFVCEEGACTAIIIHLHVHTLHTALTFACFICSSDNSTCIYGNRHPLRVTIRHTNDIAYKEKQLTRFFLKAATLLSLKDCSSE